MNIRREILRKRDASGLKAHEIFKARCSCPPCFPRDSSGSVCTRQGNDTECDPQTEIFLANARSIFDAAVSGKPITAADRDQIAYRFQLLLEEYMRDEKINAIGTFHDSPI